MATFAASTFASRSSHVNFGASYVSDSKPTLEKVWLMKQNLTHYGLRAMNKVDELSINAKLKLTARQARRTRDGNRNGRPSGTIVCGSGMVLVFVGTEVGPWSKTGGLGDVLGGLPPAMAVSFLPLSHSSSKLSRSWARLILMAEQ